MAVASSSRKPASAEAAWTQVHKFLSPAFEYSIVSFENYQEKNKGSCVWQFNWCITLWYKTIILKAISVIIHNKDFVKLHQTISQMITILLSLTFDLEVIFICSWYCSIKRPPRTYIFLINTGLAFFLTCSLASCNSNENTLYMHSFNHTWYLSLLSSKYIMTCIKKIMLYFPYFSSTKRIHHNSQLSTKSYNFNEYRIRSN